MGGVEYRNPLHTDEAPEQRALKVPENRARKGKPEAPEPGAAEP